MIFDTDTKSNADKRLTLLLGTTTQDEEDSKGLQFTPELEQQLSIEEATQIALLWLKY